jgi:hypothetical protein
MQACIPKAEQFNAFKDNRPISNPSSSTKLIDVDFKGSKLSHSQPFQRHSLKAFKK